MSRLLLGWDVSPREGQGPMNDHVTPRQPYNHPTKRRVGAAYALLPAVFLTLAAPAFVAGIGTLAVTVAVVRRVATGGNRFGGTPEGQLFRRRYMSVPDRSQRARPTTGEPQ